MSNKEKTAPSKTKSSKKQTRRGLALWIGFTLFSCAWMFGLGILVGREMVPIRFDIEKLQKELAALKEAVIKKELAQYKIDSNPDNNKTQMRFYETLKKTGDEEKLKNTALNHPKKSLPKKAVSPEETKAPTRKNASVQKEKPSDLKKPSQQDDKFTIQVASIRDPKIADSFVNRLKKEGYPAYRSIGKIPGKGIWYRVRIGYFKNRTEADFTLKRLKKEKIDAILVQR